MRNPGLWSRGVKFELMEGQVHSIPITATVAGLVPVVTIAVIVGVATVLGGPDLVAGQSTETSADGGAFEATTALISDDATDGGTAQSTNDGSGLGIGAGFAGGQCECGDARE